MATDDRLSILSDHASREQRLARVAGAQHEQLTRAQLLDAGLSHGGIGHRVRTGRLHRIHRGVYSLGRPPASPAEHWTAAVLACGEGSALSHAAGAANLAIRPSAATLIDVTSPTGQGTGQPGIRAHRSRLEPWEVTAVDGIPTTTCARTLLDLAEMIHPEALAKAVDRAEILGRFDLADLRRVLAHNRGRHGLHPLRALLSSLDPAGSQTRNDFEKALYALCRDADLPLPKPNHWLQLEGRWIQADFLWPGARFVLEADGWQTHRTRQAFERDRARDQLLLRAGYRTARVTWRQLQCESDRVGVTIRAALGI